MEMREDMTDFKEKLRDDVETSENRFISTTRDIASIVTTESAGSAATRIMQKFDPEFDLVELHLESVEIFTEYFNAFLRGDLEYLEKFSAEAALGKAQGELKIREEQGWVPETQELIFIKEFPTFNGAKVQNGIPYFTFTHEIQEINCRVNPATGEVVEGDPSSIMSASYMFTIRRHDEPNIAETGHYWEVVDVMKINETLQIV